MSLFCVKIAYSCYLLKSQCQTRTWSWNHWKTNYPEVCICPGEWRMDFCLLLTSGLRPQIYPTAKGVLGQGKWTRSHGKPLPWFLVSSHRSSSTSAHAWETEAMWGGRVHGLWSETTLPPRVTSFKMVSVGIWVLFSCLQNRANTFPLIGLVWRWKHITSFKRLASSRCFTPPHPTAARGIGDNTSIFWAQHPEQISQALAFLES